MERLCGQRMAETLGQSKPVAQHKLCGLFLSQMQITERLWVKPVPSLEQQTEAIIGSRNQVEQLFNSAAFLTAIQITEPLWVIVASFSEQPTEATTGRFKQAGPPKLFMAFPSPTRIMERFAASSWAGPASFSEQQTVETTGLNRPITRFHKAPTLSTPCPSPMRTPGRLSATLASFFRQPMEARSGIANQLSPSIICTVFRLLMPTRELPWAIRIQTA